LKPVLKSPPPLSPQAPLGVEQPHRAPGADNGPPSGGVLSRRQTGWWALATLALVLVSLWQTQQLRALQLQERQAHYAERLRTAQVVLENEMLAAAYLTSIDERTRERARHHLTQSPR
jgi:hypothetical protein